MALLHMDSFDFYATGHLGSLYDASDEVGDPGIYISAAGRNGTSGLRIRATSGGSSRTPYVQKNVTAGDVFVVGFGLNVVQNASGEIELIRFQEGGTVHLTLVLSAGPGPYTLYVRRGSVAGTTLVTAGAALLNSTYAHVELKVTIHDTTGAITLKVNNATVASGSSLDTRNAGTTGLADLLIIGNPAGNSTNFDVRYDDLFILDDAGSAPNNDMIGDVRIASLLPSGAGNYAQWTPSAGSNYQNVDEASPDDDTTYNSEATAGDKDSFVYGNLPSNAATIYGVREIVRHRKDDAGSRTLRQMVRISSTDYEGGDIAVGDGYAYATAIREQNPNTSAAWTQTNIDTDAEFGYKLEA